MKLISSLCQNILQAWQNKISALFTVETCRVTQRGYPHPNPSIWSLHGHILGQCLKVRIAWRYDYPVHDYVRAVDTIIFPEIGELLQQISLVLTTDHRVHPSY